MYRCTECHTEYQVCPEYCDCGNDTFEEVYAADDGGYEEEEYEYEYEEPVRARRMPAYPQRRRLTREEIEDLEEEKADKIKALITIGISIFISLVIICCPPYPQKKMANVQKKAAIANVKIPDVNSYWDDALPAAFRKDDPDSHLPLLNSYFSSISSNLRTYLVNTGEEFSHQWNPNVVDGSGECRIQFTINRDGVIDNKKMVLKSRNDTLDDSVLLLLSKITNLDVPPADYKGERIILAFKVDPEKGSKVYYPVFASKKAKK